MSKTFSVSADELESTISPQPGGRRCSLSTDSPCGCLSTDSKSSNPVNEGGASRSPDATEDCCFFRGSSEVNSHSDAGNHLHVVSSMNQAFVFTPVNESQVKPGRTLCRGPDDMDNCSLSSGEMVMRSKSFCLQDQSLIVFSSLDGSSLSPAQSGASFPADSPLQSTSRPKVYANSQAGVSEESSGYPCLGVTFIQGDDTVPQTSENIGSSLLALPSEEAGDLFTTFICDTPTDVLNEGNSSCAEAEPLPNVSLGTTPELCKTFVSSAFVSQGRGGIYTSTPNQNIGNKILSHPSLSPCTEKTSSPEIPPVKRPQVSVTPRQRPAAGVTPSLSRVKTMEVKPKALKKQNIQQKQLPHSFLSDGRAAAGLIRTNVKNTGRVMSATSKTQNETPSQVNPGFGHSGAAVRQSCKRKAVDVQNKNRPGGPNPTSSDSASAVQDSDGSTQSASAPGPPALPGSPTAAASSKKTPSSPHTAARTPPLRDVPNKTPVRSGSTEGRDKAPGKNTWPRSLSESSPWRPQRNRVATLRVTTSVTLPDSEVSQLLLNDPNSSQHKETEDKSFSREVKRISLVKGQSKSTPAGAPLDPNKASSHSAPSSGRGRGASFSQPTPPSPSQRQNPLSVRLKAVIQGRTEGKASRSSPLIQLKDNSGSQKAQAAEGSLPGMKAKLNGSLPPQTPNSPSVMGPPSIPVYRPTRRTPGSLKGCAELGQRARSTPVGRAVSEPSPFKSIVVKDRLPSAHGESSGLIPTGVFKSPASTNKTSDCGISPLKRNNVSRFVRPAPSECVDKNKTKVGSRRPQPQPSPPNARTGPQNVPQAGVRQSKQNNESIRPPKQLLTASNQRFQALVVVLQKTLAERDEASRQCRELLQEQLHLRQELVGSVASCNRLEKEKEELRAGLEDALHKLQNQHQKELLELEQKLQAFYQAERDDVHLRHQEEAAKHRTLAQQQIDELRAHHEAVKLELESAHVQQLQAVRQQQEKTLEELRKTHSQELQTLDKSFKDAEVALFKQVQELTEEKALLTKKLEVEQQRRRELAETSQKDSHILYLEQELESLKVVLDMKTEQLHQQEKKLVDFEKLTERNVKLDESLKKAQQENEDLKARMERHAALSRQLSTEQAVLQESLSKESKVNKRLSMENEELLWKLHNGDPSSPRRTSPSSPPGSFCLQSPRNSGLFSSPPLSPR
uniref:Microtubule associated tumor suppressor 1b n=1 Tax=Oryzias latipes TaxID=8090 RepID=A0A3P9LA55_ORYLA